MTELRFNGRVAVITGGARGLGRAYALLLAARGAKVVISDIGVSMSGEGGKAIIGAALDSFGRIDILIHNAGNVRRGMLHEISYEGFNAVVDGHMRGGFNVVREAFPHMLAQ